MASQDQSAQLTHGSWSARFKTWLRGHPAAYEIGQGIRDRLLHARYRQRGSFAQHGEDLVIAQLLDAVGARGPFVDVGCNHPFNYNNTYLLHLRGISGVCIDPLPRWLY